jgi:hypothetical protein
MVRGVTGFGELPAEGRVGVVDPERIVVPTVDAQVDHGDVGSGTGGGGRCGGDHLPGGHRHHQPEHGECPSSMSVPRH